MGKKLIHSLLLRGERHVRAFDMDPSSCDVFLDDPRVEFVQGDVTKYDHVLSVVQGSDVVYATVAVIRFMDRFAHQEALSYRINVLGSENVVRACKQAGVEMLVHTSTSNVSVGSELVSLEMDESTPYVQTKKPPPTTVSSS